MHAKSFNLAWIVVKDLKQAIQFYTEVVGLKLVELNETYGWAEVQGHQDGARLGIAKEHPEQSTKAGHNAVPTFTVENIEKAIEHLHKKGAKCQGEIQEIPGHVKLQMVIDKDGNHFQMVELLTS